MNVKIRMYRIDEIRMYNNGTQAVASPPEGGEIFRFTLGLFGP